MTEIRVLTAHDIRAILSAIAENGIACDVVSGYDNDAVLKMAWSHEVDNALEIALALVREVCPGINIRYVSGGVCKARIRIWY